MPKPAPFLVQMSSWEDARGKMKETNFPTLQGTEDRLGFPQKKSFFSIFNIFLSKFNRAICSMLNENFCIINKTP